MTINLTPHSEQLLREQMGRGTYASPEQVIERALEALAAKEHLSDNKYRKTPVEAVADIRKLRQGVTLGGLKIRDLINKGRKY